MLQTPAFDRRSSGSLSLILSFFVTCCAAAAAVTSAVVSSSVSLYCTFAFFFTFIVFTLAGHTQISFHPIDPHQSNAGHVPFL
jgi:hypothetical protein